MDMENKTNVLMHAIYEFGASMLYAFSVKTGQPSTRHTDNHIVNKLNLAKKLPMSTVTVGHRTHL
jgi:hypothetical protein